MKKYSFLAILQKEGPQSESDENALDGYGGYITESLKSSESEFLKMKSDLIHKNGTILRGGLTHFLSTPLKSDKDDIAQLIKDTIENTIQQLDAAPLLSTVEHSVWKILEPSEIPLHRKNVGSMKNMLKNGRAQLSKAGCSFGKNSGEVAVSHFSYEGFSTIQPLANLIDIYTSRNGISLYHGSLTTILHSAEPSEATDKKLLIINFDLHDDGIIDVLFSQASSAIDHFGVRDFSISKQVLPNAIGTRYQIRFDMDIENSSLGNFIMALVGDNESLQENIAHLGSLIVLDQHRG